MNNHFFLPVNEKLSRAEYDQAIEVCLKSMNLKQYSRTWSTETNRFTIGNITPTTFLEFLGELSKYLDLWNEIMSKI